MCVMVLSVWMVSERMVICMSHLSFFFSVYVFRIALGARSNL